MKYKIVSDSSSNRFDFEGVEYQSVPLKISTHSKEYVDDARLDVGQMVEELRRNIGRSGTSCPNTKEWLDAFEGADAIFAVTITSQLSGSCSAAMQAAEMFLVEHPEAKVCVLDTLSTGPEMGLIMEKLREMIDRGMAFEEIEAGIRQYMQQTHLFFALRSMTNLARNGRVSPAVAALAGALGICILGKASDAGVLEQMHKCRGEKKLLRCILDEMKAHGYDGGRVRIDHCMNLELAERLREILQAEYPDADVQIGECKALCSFYAEKGGLLLGFEGAAE